MRYQIHNLIFLGVLVQKQKPEYGVILIDMIKMLQKHFLSGFMLNIGDNQTVHFRSLVTNILLDIAERGKVLNCAASGFFGCHLCEILGCYCGGAVHYLDLDSPPRTFKSFREAAFKASKLLDDNPNELVDIKGIRGFSVFSLLPFCFIPR